MIALSWLLAVCCSVVRASCAFNLVGQSPSPAISPTTSPALPVLYPVVVPVWNSNDDTSTPCSDGIWSLSRSSALSEGDEVWQAFDGVSGSVAYNGFSSAAGKYYADHARDAGDPCTNGGWCPGLPLAGQAYRTQNVDGGAFVDGEFLQIAHSSVPLRLVSFNLTSWWGDPFFEELNARQVAKFVVLGSDDGGASWTTVFNQTTALDDAFWGQTDTTPKAFTPATTPGFYKIHRLVITEIRNIKNSWSADWGADANPFRDSASLAEWRPVFALS